MKNLKISDWWNKNMKDELLPTFEGWVKDYNAITKKYSREYIVEKQYKSMLDVGCGLCSMYDGFVNDGYEIEYMGLDSCTYFLDKAKNRNISVINSDMNEIKLENDTYDVVFARHVLEHQPTFEYALEEFIRIAKKEVIVVFFIKPQDKEIIKYGEDDLYHNVYSKKDIESSVKNFEWIDFGDEVVLHIKK